MLKKFCFCFLLFCSAFDSAKADPLVTTDSLLSVFQIKDKKIKEEQLVNYIKNTLLASSINNLYAEKSEINELLGKNNLESKKAFKYYVESVYQGRLSHDNESKSEMVKAIQSAGQDDDYFLSYTFLNLLAYKQTEDGDIIGAVSSYRMATQDAVKLNDANLQLIIDINISDAYYKNDFYSQSLFYLNQAQAIIAKFWPDDERIKNTINYNKCEIFFRMDRPDSLTVYNEKLNKSIANTYKLYTYKNRTHYYLYMLHHNYINAINLIHAMQNDEGYKFDEGDWQNLSDAFYKNGQLDSAKFIIHQLLSGPSEINHPEIKYHLYDVLGKIAEKQGDYKSASANFKLSLQQTKENMSRLTQVDNISSLIKLDEVEGYYSQKNKAYQKERTWLIFVVIFAVLIILVIAMFYRIIKQKRYYEKLLFTAKKEELAFINSHDVRKHLSNILGLIEVIRQSDNREKEYLETENQIFHSALELDKAIRNISEKLDD